VDSLLALHFSTVTMYVKPEDIFWTFSNDVILSG